MDNLLVYESSSRIIIFEPKRVLPNDFIEGKKWLNSIALETGGFPEYIFNRTFCRKPTVPEIDHYTSLKDRSIYTLNAE